MPYLFVGRTNHNNCMHQHNLVSCLWLPRRIFELHPFDDSVQADFLGSEIVVHLEHSSGQLFLSTELLLQHYPLHCKKKTKKKNTVILIKCIFYSMMYWGLMSFFFSIVVLNLFTQYTFFTICQNVIPWLYKIFWLKRCISNNIHILLNIFIHFHSGTYALTRMLKMNILQMLLVCFKKSFNQTLESGGFCVVSMSPHYDIKLTKRTFSYLSYEERLVAAWIPRGVEGEMTSQECMLHFGSVSLPPTSGLSQLLT